MWRIVYRGAGGTETSNSKLQTSGKLQISNGENIESAAGRLDGAKGTHRTDVKGAEALMKQAGATPALPGNDFGGMGVKELIGELGSGNITRRMLAMDELTDRVGEGAASEIKRMLKDKKATSFQRVHGLWVLQRLGKLEENMVAMAAKDGDRLVRVHAMRILSETADWTAKEDGLATEGLKDSDAYVQRAAADALGRHPGGGHAAGLIAVEERQKLQTSNSVAGGKLANISKLKLERNSRLRKPQGNTELQDPNEQDGQLLYGVRMSLRNQLLPGRNFATVLEKPMGEAESRAIADVALGIPTTEARRFLSRHIQRFDEPRNTLSDYLRHIVRYAPDEEIGRLAELIRTKFADDLDFQLALFKSIQEGPDSGEASFRIQ